MKIYLAGPWACRGDMPELAERIEEAGHTITHRWWHCDAEGNGSENKEFLEQCAKDDVEGVRTCDIVVCINNAPSEGKVVEQGLAIAYEKPIILVTPSKKPANNIFHSLHHYYHVKTLNEAIKAIKEQYQ